MLQENLGRRGGGVQNEMPYHEIKFDNVLPFLFDFLTSASLTENHKSHLLAEVSVT